LQKNLVYLVGALTGALSLFVPSFLIFRENRLALGSPKNAIAAFDALGIWLFLLWILLLGLGLYKNKGKNLVILEGLIANFILIFLFYATGKVALEFDLKFGGAARTSLGYGFWLNLLGIYLILFSLTKKLKKFWTKILISYSGFLGVIILLFFNHLRGLSLLKEYSLIKETFWQEAKRHLFLTAGPVGVALILGLFFGLWAYKSHRAEKVIFAVFNIAQVIPTLSFIGFLMLPFSYLGSNFEFLNNLGVGGVGWAPAFTVLVFYAIYPILRNVVAGLKTVPLEVKEAAYGMGLTYLQVFTKIELPLALPVIVAGLRVSLVQTAGNAILAGLVGGGGFGSLVFLGLAQTADDLIFLGAIPIALLALILDRGMLVLQSFISKKEGGTSDFLCQREQKIREVCSSS